MRVTLVATALIGLSALAMNINTATAAPGLQFPWPSGVYHRVTTSQHGYNCVTHTGVDQWALDFDLGFGEAVTSTAAGTVAALVISSTGYGNHAIINHGGGFSSLYGHFKDPGPFPAGLAQGSPVGQGQLIGYADSTGNSTGNHLHFVVYQNGGAYKPEPLSGVRGFDQFGLCTGVSSGSWISRHPHDPQKFTNSSTTFGGSHKDDAVVFYQDTGTWFVAPSTGATFSGHSPWIGGHGIGSRRQLAADVNQGGITDSVVFFADTGSWSVSLSSGSGYGTPGMWRSGHGIGSTNQFLQDVNQDGRADAVIFFPDTGRWYVALSTGSGFGTPSLWRNGHGQGSNDQLLADVTGDLRADAIVYFESTGQWFVAPSTGSSFGAFTSWIAGHGVGSDRRMIGDVNGDLKGDSVVYFGDTGRWYVAMSSGSSFGSWSLWRNGHGQNSDNQLLADVTGDNKADAGVYFGAYFSQIAGNWYVANAPASGSGFLTPVLWKTAYGLGS